MGNCVDLMSSRPLKKIRVLIPGGGEDEFGSSTTVENITSGCYLGYNLMHHSRPDKPLPLATNLKLGELCYLLPRIGHCRGLPVHKRRVVDGGGSRGWKVKVVVSREQLELLLRSADKFQAKARAFWSRDGCRKWQPSLATIPE